MSVKYIGPDDRYAADRLVGLGFAYGVFGAVVYFGVGLILLVLTKILVVGGGFLSVLAIWAVPLAIFVVPLWAGLCHRVGVVNFQRFALMGAIYALTLAVISLIFIGPLVSSVFDVFGFMISVLLVAWVGFVMSWVPVWACTQRVMVVAPGHCVDCNYYLRGLESDVCPECGRGFERSDLVADVGDLEEADEA